VSIHAVERFLGDQALEHGWKPKKVVESTGKKALVVGAGPSGLSAAYHLSRLGHEVEIRESGHEAGGMLRYGIPAYRMPREELDAEIKRIEVDMGVQFTFNHPVDDVLKEKQEGGFDAVFVAVGAQLGNKIHLPGSETSKIIDAVAFLRDIGTDSGVTLGKRVAIYGGGNTAMDSARTAKRLGAEEVMILYRRDRKAMPAHDFEVDEALDEGIKIHFLRTIKNIEHSTIEVEVMELDENARPCPSGKTEILRADNVILAIGQSTDSDFLRKTPDIEFKKDGTVIVGPDMMTDHAGIFAGGDMTPSERSVTIAVGHGKKAARFINGYLTDQPYQTLPKHPIVDHEKLHIWYRTDAPQREQEQLSPEERTQSFDEILQGLDETEARFEAQRCLSCGNCFECDGCYASCPEGAVVKLGEGKRYLYDYDLCTGCQVCAEQCPCHAIDMIADEAPNPVNVFIGEPQK